ncbi:uncharacterized protein LOC129794271 [Lutzomyia longipalpis]|uniref:uncharacterized protein LOC129794271 n=1 Tax=Lutzomyia longipalpis TaxID=7200 RepID=UPI002483A990|nr:uncharacterized protein LOC129794271 [Lutzomyia longipalpis]
MGTQRGTRHTFTSVDLAILFLIFSVTPGMCTNDRKGPGSTSTAGTPSSGRRCRSCSLNNLLMILGGKSFFLRRENNCESTSTSGLVVSPLTLFTKFLPTLTIMLKSELQLRMETIHPQQHIIDVILVDKHKKIIHILFDAINSQLGALQGFIKESLKHHVSDDGADWRSHGHAIKLKEEFSIVQEITRCQAELHQFQEIPFCDLCVRLNLRETPVNLFKSQINRNVRE